MAFVMGRVTAEELEAVLGADYSVTVQDKFSWAEVWLECSVIDLLSPPLCKFCGRLMRTHSSSLGTVYTCECGARVEIRTHPPRGE